MDLAFWIVVLVVACGGVILLRWPPMLIARLRRSTELRVPMTAKRIAELYDRDVH